MTNLIEQFPDIIAVSLPELILLSAAFAGILAGAVLKERFDSLSFILAALALFAASAATVFNLAPAQAFVGCLESVNGQDCRPDKAFFLLRSHAFIDFVRCICYALAGFAILMSLGHLRNLNAVKFEYPLLVLFASFGIGISLTSANLMSLYMGVETTSLCSYILAAYLRNSSKSSEAGLKYFILGALSSCLLLYGASLVFGFTGSTQYGVIAANIGQEPALGLIFGLVLMIIGLGFKVSAAPMHVWTPDVYEGGPTPVVAFFASVPKLSGLALLTIILFEVFGSMTADWQLILAMMSGASMVIGTLAALAQSNIKRLLAYSSIANVGYALIGIVAGTSLGVRSLLIFMTIYSITALGLFLGVMLMRRKGGMVEDISELSGLARSQPIMATSLTLLLLSVAGLPSGGLWGKIALIQAGLSSGWLPLVVLLVLTSVVALAYYLKIIWIMWVGEPVAVFEKIGDGLKTGIALCAFIAAIVLFFAIGALERHADMAARALGI